MSFHIGGDGQKIGWVISVSLTNILLGLIYLIVGYPSDFEVKAGIGLLIIDKRQRVQSKLSITLTRCELLMAIIWKGQRLSLYDVFLPLFSIFVPVCAVA